jgi:hypothetical protein
MCACDYLLFIFAHNASIMNVVLIVSKVLLRAACKLYDSLHLYRPYVNILEAQG